VILLLKEIEANFYGLLEMEIVVFDNSFFWVLKIFKN